MSARKAPNQNLQRSASAISSSGVAANGKKDRRQLVLHDSFRVGITLKGIGAILEAAGGVLLWFVRPAALNKIAFAFLDYDLPLDRHDFIATHLFRATMHLASGSKHFASLYLLTHGLIKLALVAALWLDVLWAYPVTIFVFGVFSAYQVYRFTHTHSVALILLTVFDVLIIWLTWQEYQGQKRVRRA